MADKNKEKFGFVGLTALTFGMMMGSGIFNIPQNMAAAAAPGAAALSWVITAIGMLLLTATFKILADRRPDLSAGIYQYARAGFGDYAGFNTAWGYWLCTCFANIAFTVMLCDSFGAFFPSLINNAYGILLCGTLFIWLMCLIVAKGIHIAKALNNILSIAKVIVIIAIIILMALNFKLGTFRADTYTRLTDLGGLGAQLKNTMLVTLWCFIGIEGAVVMSSRARKTSDVGKAGITGFLLAWILYFLISMLCFGMMAQPQIAHLDNPSVAYLLKSAYGDWAYYFVIIAVIVSILGGWVAWTMICAEVPYEAATLGIFPKVFTRLNSRHTPIIGLIVSSIVMQLFLILVVTGKDYYLAALSITGMMVLPPYLFSALYLWKSTLRPARLGLTASHRNRHYRIIAIACTIFCLWMIYAGGLKLFMLTSIFYLPGIIFYLRARKQARLGHPTPLPKPEIAAMCAISICALLSIWLLTTGALQI